MTIGRITNHSLQRDDRLEVPYKALPEALYRTTWLENWGTGAKRIIEACREQGVEEPTWRRDGGFVYVIFKRPSKSSLEGHDPQNSNGTSEIYSNKQKSQESSSENQNRSPESSPEILASSPEFTNSSSETKVLLLLKSYPSLTLERVASLIKMTKRGVIKITNRLQGSGRLSRKGANKNGEWVVTE